MIIGLLALGACRNAALEVPVPHNRVRSTLPVSRGTAAAYSDFDIACCAEGNTGCCGSVAGGGDFNGDGEVDLAASSTGNSSLGESGHAEVYLGPFPGSVPATGTILNAVEDYEADVIPIAVAGDVNADGYDDVIIAADDVQLIKLYAGSAAGVTADPTWTLPEFAGDRSVASVAGAGDVNSDGYDDVIVGVKVADAPGSATVHLGSADGIRDDESNQVLRSGSAENDVFGFKVSGAGDANGDGYDDVIVGAGGSFTTVCYGSSAGVLSTGCTTLDAETISYSVAGAGDVNGDGYDDVLVGMGNTEPSGSAALFVGGRDGVDPTPAWTRSGVEGGYRHGWAVAGIGDINSDGFGEIIAGSDQVPELFLGCASGLAAEPAVSLGCCGYSLSTAGDIDHDGLPDVVVSTGGVYLASTLVAAVAAADTDTDTDTEPAWDSDTQPSADSDTSGGTPSDDGDTGGRSGGCGGKGGCATVSRPRGGFLVAWIVGAVVALRRRGVAEDAS